MVGGSSGNITKGASINLVDTEVLDIVMEIHVVLLLYKSLNYLLK